jgi:hypothetical protein
VVEQIASSSDIAAGQMDPGDTNSDFTVFSFIVEQMQAQLDIAKPVQVVAVHPGAGSPPVAGTVDVQILVSGLDGAGNGVQRGIVYGVPYFRIQGGPWAVVCDPAANDFGFVVCADRDISNVVINPGIVLPGSRRQNSVSDGIYLGGCFNTIAEATIWLKTDGTWAITDKPGNVLEGTSNGIEATPVGTFIVHGDIHASGAVIAGFGGADQIGLQTHEHTANNTPPTPGT